MNNEPVAWGWYDLEIKRFFPHWDEDLMENKEGCIPLYTHPTKTEDEGKVCARCGAIAYDPVITQTAKTLTDEEIYKIAMEVQTGFFPQDDTLAFARAILRKAQEK